MRRTDTLIDAGANAFDLLVRGSVGDRSRLPASIVEDGPQRTVYRFQAIGGARPHHAPVLLVPPLAAPVSCFDLRRGCSVAEHLTRLGYPTYVVDYGPISFSDRELGLEHWVDEVIPRAVEAVEADAKAPVQLLGWCLGGIMSLLSVAAHRELPVRSVAMVASPFDFARVRMMAPIRQLSKLTGGALGTALYRALGGAPAPLVSIGFRLTAIDRLVTKPVTVARHLHDREWLAHMQAIDDYMANMLAYPGRTFGQLYHQFFRANDLAGGAIELGGREVRLAEVEQPVLNIGGTTDVLAPLPAVHAVGDLLPNAEEVVLERAPGGHLGVLTGRGAVETTWRYLDDFLARHDVAARAPVAA